MSKYNIYHGKFVKNVLGTLTPTSPEAYKLFLEGLSENQIVEVFIEANEDNGTTLQLAKIHVCIRELAKELGYTFNEMKNQVKKDSGFCIETKEGEDIYKSFSVCSKEELGLVIQTINRIGEIVGINFHEQSQI
jgi:hypothetical protein